MEETDVQLRALYGALEAKIVCDEVNEALNMKHAVLDGSKTQKKRKKTTYEARKDEKKKLAQELKELEQMLKQLETDELTKHEQLYTKRLQANTFLHTAVQRSDFAIAGAKSLISCASIASDRNPLETFIYLSADLEQRQSTLLNLCNTKLQHTMQFLLHCTQSLPLNRSHSQRETHDATNGDFMFTHFDITPFYNVKSVRQVYDQLLYYISHEEYCVSEKLGIITMADNDTHDNSSVTQTRYQSTLPGNIEFESNFVGFKTFYTKEEGHGQEYGIQVLDYVNHDQLYPYQPRLRLRSDINVAMMVVACPKDENSKDLVVSLLRCVYLRLHRPMNGLTQDLQYLAHEYLTQWGMVLPAFLRERLRHINTVAANDG